MITNASNHPVIANEKWLPIPDWEDLYEVSDMGRVRRRKPGGKYLAGHMLTPLRVRDGYVRVELNRNNKTSAYYIHRLVLSAFVSVRKDGEETCHNNNIRDDNRLENLRWGTRVENMADRSRSGNNPMASKTHCIRNHEFTEANTYRQPGVTSRACRKCKEIHKAAYKARRALRGLQELATAS